jgi:Helix-turn-helix domain
MDDTYGESLHREGCSNLGYGIGEFAIMQRSGRLLQHRGSKPNRLKICLRAPQMARKTFKFRLYSNRQQRDKLTATLDVCRELYNASLEERIGAWKTERRRSGHRGQSQPKVPAVSNA